MKRYKLGMQNLQNTRNYLLILFLLLLVFKVHSHDNPAGDKLNSDTIYVGTEPNYPPFCMLGKNGNPEGFSVELFEASAKAAGLHVKFKVGLWNIIQKDLLEGRLHALPIVAHTPGREEFFEFTMPYITLHGAVFVRKNDKSIKTLDDLKNKEIIVMRGDNAEEFVLRENLTDKIFTTSTFEEAFIRFNEGNHDAVLLQRFTGIRLLEKMGITSIVPLEKQFNNFREDYCFAVANGNEALINRLNEGLSIIIADNTYNHIYSKYFGPGNVPKYSVQDTLLIVVLVFVPLAIFMSLLLIFILRREVRLKTKKLNQEIADHRDTLEKFQSKQTQISETEAQIRLLLNSTAEGIYGIDLSGKCIFVNKSAMQMLGFMSDNEIIGENMHDLIHHAYADGIPCDIKECRILNALAEKRGIHVEDEVFWKKNGIPFPVEYYAYPVTNNAQITGAVVTFWDITDQKKIQHELRLLKEELEIQVAQRTAELEEKVQKLNKSQKAMLYMVEDLNLITQELKEERRKLKISNQELDAFSYSVSHDLRSPLRAIDGFSRFLLEDYAHKLDDEGKRLINVIRQNTAKMDVLISDLLNLSRITRVEINFVQVDMFATARSMFLEVATPAEKESFQIEIGNLPAANCDFGLIKQVWQNLIGNALKYSSKSLIKRIEIGHTEHDGKLCYFVKDEGIGFDPRYADKLFNAFQRLHKSDEFEGTGVGLAIVQRIIHRHGGEVWAEGETDKGAKFYFTLPNH